jgi:AhpD family alkylhydroperoxidase
MASPQPSVPRIPPGTAREIGLLSAGIARVLGAATGTGPPHLFTTLARHRRMFLPWLRFASTLMPRGTLPRQDSELVILRVAHRCDCEYERDHHERLAREAGLTADQIQRIGHTRPRDDDWTPRQKALIDAADELHDNRVLSNEVWDRLAAHLTEPQLIELPMLVGHYEMLAMTLNTLRVQPDRPDPRRPRGRSTSKLIAVSRLLRRKGHT